MPRLEFKGRSVVWNHHLGVPYRELIARTEKGLSKKPSLHDNLIIHGDNLHALKALLPTYAGKVKCIYIDPPYNTGNEGWKYNDNVNSPTMKEWLGKEVGIDDEERHDKWLCMMTPRLKLLRELLHDDGLIFVSIDDNEVGNLRLLMDEIFGEFNFRNIIVAKRGVKSVQAQFETTDKFGIGAEYVLMYSKNADLRIPHLHVELNNKRSGSWNNHWRGTDRPTMRYELFGITPETGQWRWSEARSAIAMSNYSDLINELGISGREPTDEEVDQWYERSAEEYGELDLLRLSPLGKPEHFVPPSETKLGHSLWYDMMANESNTLKKLFGKKVFENPKSYKFLSRIIGYIASNPNSIILDSFAGSGTTAHAVLDLNKDGGNRKFILVECEDYADSITAERVRRVIKGVPAAKDPALKAGLGGTFSFFELGNPVEIDRLLSGKGLPSYEELARYVFFTATGEELDPKKVNAKTGYIGSAREYDIYMIYQPDVEFLKANALTLDFAKALPPHKNRKRVVFAPARFISQEFMSQYRVEYCQLPYELYRSLK